jgi:ribose-phosphate pyrophosphokinase
MEITLFAGSANVPLAVSIADHLGLALGNWSLIRFPDSELHVEIQESARGHDVYLIQPTAPPVNETLMELLLLADACRRAGAERLTAIVPYFGYARQDRRAAGRDSVGARLVADLIGCSGIQRIVAVDLHTSALEGFFRIPLEHLSAMPILARDVRDMLPARPVLLAPDLGAVKLARRYAKLLNAPMAIVHKTRLSGEEVETHGVVGDVRGRVPIIVDDMISTGGTIAAASRAAIANGCEPGTLVISTHGLFVGSAPERLGKVPVERFVVTDSVSQRETTLPVSIVSLGSLLAEAIKRLHESRSLSDLIVHE